MRKRIDMRGRNFEIDRTTGETGREAGATLIELIMVITILGILAAATSGIVISLLQAVVYLPREVKARTIAQEALHTFVEGDIAVNGLRFARGIVASWSTGSNVTYDIGYPTPNMMKLARRVEIKWYSSATPWRMLRRYSPLGSPTLSTNPPPSTYQTIPYYTTSEIKVNQIGATPVFRYYKSDGTSFTPTGGTQYQIRRVDITFKVDTGSGLFRNWDASFPVLTGVDIKQYTEV